MEELIHIAERGCNEKCIVAVGREPGMPAFPPPHPEPERSDPVTRQGQVGGPTLFGGARRPSIAPGFGMGDLGCGIGDVSEARFFR